MYFVAVKESQIPPDLGIYSWSGNNSAFTAVRGGCHLSIEGIRKGYLFCRRWYVKGKGGGGKVCGPSSYNTLLSAPLAHYRPQREAVCSFAACYCHILCFLLFSYSIGMHPLSLHQSLLSALPRDTSHVSVRPIKTFLHDKPRRKFFPRTLVESVHFRAEFANF